VTCLSTEQLVDLVLDEATSNAQRFVEEHARACHDCNIRTKRVREQLGRVATAVLSDSDYALGKERLLTALGNTDPAAHIPTLRSHVRLTGIVRHFWIPAAVVALVFLVFYFAWDGLGVSTAPAQTAKAMQQMKSYRCRVTKADVGQESGTEIGTFYWAVAGLVCMEVYRGDKLAEFSVVAKDKPGLRIDYLRQTYRRMEPARGGLSSPLLLMDELARFVGSADRLLPTRYLPPKQAAKGFEIAVGKIDPDAGKGVVRVWPDPKSKLPLYVEIELADIGKLAFREFSWNVPAEPLFDTKPPGSFVDETRARPSVEEQTKQIVTALRTHAKYCGGKYPAVKIVYGDVTRAELFRHAGLGNGQYLSAEQIRTEKYRECVEAGNGFARMNGIQRENPDAAYYGMKVHPNDKDKVLFRWRLDGERYRVIFGDLHAETVTPAKLKELEGS
jgi:hypothetical protein